MVRRTKRCVHDKAGASCLLYKNHTTALEGGGKGMALEAADWVCQDLVNTRECDVAGSEAEKSASS